MIKLTKILFLLSIFVSLSHAYAKPSYSINYDMGFSAFNAEGLNKITEGLDSGYGTSFGHIRVPLALSGGFSLSFSRSVVALELGYEFANRDSYSSIYNITENIKYSALPLGIKYSYRFYDKGKWRFLGSLSTGVMWVWFSMNNQPSLITGSTSFETGASAWYISPSVEAIYYITRNVGFNAMLGARYASTSKFKYTSADSRHNNGDYVTFSDGSNLTMNISGLKFLIGIILSWG